MFCFCFCKQKTADEMRISDWSSDVCSSDLVHRAWRDDGRPVVLKIRRPGVRPRIEADLRIVTQLTALAEQASAEARRFSPRALARQLAESLRDELDFTIEGRNADRLREDFAGDQRVLVPDIHWAWSSETLMVMDFRSEEHKSELTYLMRISYT